MKRVTTFYLSIAALILTDQSSDKAKTWEKINSTQPLHWPKDFAVDLTDSECVLIGAGNLSSHKESGLYGTSDGGRIWHLLASKGP